ncbi:spore coat polysaccharide biosynthesis protein; SpsC [Synechocystis sp. PCC 6803]|uniref:Spore coat polysaccharide biosynthesis protein SpsC n=1 Tax=Synechocystis sp. (strain ATCC 27184 / PCC 6803 / Kazusa) TaxID=1111708 RepID=P73981_SYNY3|nr:MULTISPECIES: DegT/DnrJ/EryC1/StrS family aminotransferase [unclassified Synechocystis]BAM51797.1 spore coat polysaccharide biosynthesis proteinSpsC [Synechocystis sp. PCC 6803] [Bacillus subtilis BEST7613]AGF51739.1 spore coat polysaccharide biosynthesis protein SpsC [Synechocystis sp. PCC 6803]ALJ67728.1 aminotransferase DegT [Synechocystis sp. PCC 6803]AVP89559.1 DegT/DnrJ/EryC1/StrS family aminotransferase [Synechocystis sp. IPPAS B-1465]MBD2618685.1 DegT/DnrJ/EryC1/StrS family aminotra
MKLSVLTVAFSVSALFETTIFAEFCGTKYAVAVSSGTAALHLALLALNIGAGDEVIVPTLSFIATANAVTYTGAKPIFVDSEWETWNINPDLIEAAITPRTKAIMPVHLYGHPAKMDKILDIAQRYHLAVIEDAAEAHGATYQGKTVGSLGDLGIFSFYGNKIVTTGEGGMIVTDDEELAQKIRILKDHGMSKKQRYWHPILGYNYRITNIQAALGVAQMERINKIPEAKRRIAQLYEQELLQIQGLTLPPRQPWAESVFWLYTILINQDKLELNRDQLMSRLQEKGIETRPLFIPIHRQPIYNTHQSLPVAESLSKNGLSLPSFVTLSNENLYQIIDSIKKVIS